MFHVGGVVSPDPELATQFHWTTGLIGPSLVGVDLTMAAARSVARRVEEGAPPVLVGTVTGTPLGVFVAGVVF